MKKSIYTMLVIPCLILLVLTLMVPLLTLVVPTFGDVSGYFSLFKDETFQVVLWRTLKIGVISTCFCVLLGVPTAYYISRCDKSRRSLLMALSLFPLLTNSVIRAFAWTTILGKNGVINTLLLKIGIITEPLTILYTEFSIIIGTIYLFLPLMITTLVGVMEHIEDDYYDAALSLGANKIVTFLKVVLPMSMPGIVVGCTLVFTGAITAYTTPFLLGGNKNMVLATLLSQQVGMQAWDKAAMIALVMVVVTIIVIQLLQLVAKRLDKRGEA